MYEDLLQAAETMWEMFFSVLKKKSKIKFVKHTDIDHRFDTSAKLQ